VKLGREQHIPIIVYLIPELHDLSVTYPFMAIHRKSRNLGIELGLSVVDLLPVFSGYSPEEGLWVSPTGVHPNALAQATIARGIYVSFAADLIKA
jgi:hypothetical protein